MMTGDQFAGVIRALVAAAGGYFVGQGYVDAETATAVGGAVVTLAVAAWSVWSKRKAA
jgi:membrane protein DedA with SNARE-associated domain